MILYLKLASLEDDEFLKDVYSYSHAVPSTETRLCFSLSNVGAMWTGFSIRKLIFFSPCMGDAIFSLQIFLRYFSMKLLDFYLFCISLFVVHMSWISIFDKHNYRYLQVRLIVWEAIMLSLNGLSL